MILIDVDALMDVILHSQKINRECELEEDAIDTYDNGQQETFDLIINIIDNQPTAYNVDMVVEQLKGLHEGYKCTDNEFQRGAKAGAHYVLNRAIEIVKGGGVDE